MYENNLTDEDALVRNLSSVMGEEFWNYFKKANGELRKVERNNLVEGQKYIARRHNDEIVLAREVYSCDVDIEHFIQAKGYRLDLDYGSRETLKKKILDVIISIWGDLLEAYGDKNKNEKIFKRDKEKVNKILQIVFNAMSEFIRYKVSKLSKNGGSNYKQYISGYYKKWHSDKAINERYTNKIDFLNVGINPTPIITPPFLPSDACQIALHKLLVLGATKTLSKIILKKAFNSNTCKKTPTFKEYELLQFKLKYENAYKKEMETALQDDEDTEVIEIIEENYQQRKKAFEEGRRNYIPQNPFYMLEAEKEIEHQKFLENWIDIKFEFKDTPATKEELENMKKPKIIIYD